MYGGDDEFRARTSSANDRRTTCLWMPIQTQTTNANKAWGELKTVGRRREQILVNPFMLFLMMPKKIHNDGTIELLTTDTNHNTLIGNTAYEIANNITNDPIRIDGEQKERSFGYGIDVTATYFPPVR